jgi:hypothetical protein
MTHRTRRSPKNHNDFALHAVLGQRSTRELGAPDQPAATQRSFDPRTERIAARLAPRVPPDGRSSLRCRARRHR